MSGEALRARWEGAWAPALAAWSRYTQLRPPTFCTSAAQEEQEGLTGSFAMIRLRDHAVVISLRQVEEQGLGAFAVEILAHEIGHHVLSPGDLRDNARLLARVRAGLPTVETAAPMVANLYADLLINDRLQRQAGLDLAGVYRALRAPTGSRVWGLYLRIYERLWARMRGELHPWAGDARLDSDADLGARLVRVYARDWLQGASRFACLLLPYLLEDQERAQAQGLALPWLDGLGAGVGELIPDGLAGLDDDELGGVLHPAEDPRVTGAPMSTAELPGTGTGAERVGGVKNRYRDPLGYVALMEALGVKVQKQEMVARYYRERALPYLIPFPTRRLPQASDPLPEGVELWEPGDPLHALDWVETLSRSPVVVPGYTTVERTWGESAGGDPAREAPDLYLGIDCSGSMGNPALQVSWPVLAGTVLALSALRAGARVMACLSGEPGRFTQTAGFVRDSAEVLHILTSYLGTGYSFGILRLKDSFLDAPPRKRPAHILVVTDSDIFHMLKSVPDGWDIAAEALQRAGGGGTMALGIPDPQRWAADLERLAAQGWDLRLVRSQEELVDFARAFARRRYAQDGGPT